MKYELAWTIVEIVSILKPFYYFSIPFIDTRNVYNTTRKGPIRKKKKENVFMRKNGVHSVEHVNRNILFSKSGYPKGNVTFPYRKVACHCAYFYTH
jgi:hypothetical protein